MSVAQGAAQSSFASAIADGIWHPKTAHEVTLFGETFLIFGEICQLHFGLFMAV